MLGKTCLIRPAWRHVGAHALRESPRTSKVRSGGFESLSAPETHGKRGITPLDTLRHLRSSEFPATEMVLDLKQNDSEHIVTRRHHTHDTAVGRVEKSILPRSLDQNASYEELARELSEYSPLESQLRLETLREHTERPISNPATSVQPDNITGGWPDQPDTAS